MSDKQLQRQLAVARQIHAGMHGDSREVVLPRPEIVSEQGRKMAIRIGAAFMVLVFVNVGIGLWFIFRHESNNPNRPLLEASDAGADREIDRARGSDTLANTKCIGRKRNYRASREREELIAVADQVVAIVSRLGGSATKGASRRRPRHHTCRRSGESGTGIS